MENGESLETARAERSPARGLESGANLTPEQEILAGVGVESRPAPAFIYQKGGLNLDRLIGSAPKKAPKEHSVFLLPALIVGGLVIGYLANAWYPILWHFLGSFGLGAPILASVIVIAGIWFLVDRLLKLL